MSTLDRHRPEFEAHRSGSGYVSVPDKSFLIYQVAVVCLIVFGTVCLSSLVLYFSVVRPLKKEVAILHVDNQATKTELKEFKASLGAAQTDIAKITEIQGTLSGIEQQLREIQQQLQVFQRRISNNSYNDSGSLPEPSYSLAGVGGGGGGSSGCGGGLALLLLLLLLGGGIVGGSNR